MTDSEEELLAKLVILAPILNEAACEFELDTELVYDV
jgi:hypothetical protein